MDICYNLTEEDRKALINAELSITIKRIVSGLEKLYQMHGEMIVYKSMWSLYPLLEGLNPVVVSAALKGLERAGVLMIKERPGDFPFLLLTKWGLEFPEY